jgi:hypothetical protein
MPEPTGTPNVELQAELERRFRRAGLPLFIQDYTAAEDIFTRALPLLALVFVALVLNALNLEWGFWANVGAFLGAIAFMAAAFGLFNVARHRPFLSMPRRIGRSELAAFVLIPALLPLMFGGQLVSSLVTIVALVAFLGLIYLVVGFGLLSILRWTGARLFSGLGSSLRTLVRAIPLLLFFSLLLFLTTEMWQVLATAPRAYLGAVTVLVMGLGAVFLLARVPKEVAALEREAGAGAGEEPLSRLQLANVGLVLFVSQAVQVLFVGLGVALFFTIFGAFTVSPTVLNEWIGNTGHTVWSFGLFGHRVVITQELLRVAGAIGAFSGLYYAITALIDPTYREEFTGEMTNEMRSVFEDRAEYLRLRAGGTSAAGPVAPSSPPSPPAGRQPA